MTKIMKRTIVSLFLAFTAIATMSAQQTVVQNKDLDAFSTVTIGEKFSFRLKSAPTYSVRIISDERIAEFVRPVVKNGAFSITLDEKKYPAELKKALKAKGAIEPFLEVEIYAPTVKKLEIKEKAVMLDADDIKVDAFELRASGSSKINRLKVECVNANLSFGGNNQSSIDITVDTKLNILAENSSTSSITQRGGNSIVESRGSSVLNLNVMVVDVDLETHGGSSIYLSGRASMLDVEAEGGSTIDAEALEVKEGNFLQSGSSKCHVNVEERIKVNLTGGCMLTFKRKPVIEVERIVNSTLIKADDPKRK